MLDNKLATIKRPPMLMASAVEFVKRRQQIGKNQEKLDDLVLAKIIEAEAQLERARTKKDDQYALDRHISLLADLIAEASRRLGEGRS